MSAVHGLLSKLPESLNYEQLIRVAAALFEKYPPKQVAKRGKLKMSNRSVIITGTFLHVTSPPIVEVNLPNLYFPAIRHLFYSTLISSYPDFLETTSSQLPDHLLRHRAPPPKTHGWWHWLTKHRTAVVTSLLSVATPVLLAVLVYWVYRLVPDKRQSLLTTSLAS